MLLVTAAINIVGDIVLGGKFGLFGIVLATAIARIFTNAWYDPYAVFKYGLHISPWKYFAKYIKYALLLVGTTAICFGICGTFEFALPLQALVKVVICTIVPNGLFMIVFGKTTEFQYLLGKVKMMFKRILK